MKSSFFQIGIILLFSIILLFPSQAFSENSNSELKDEKIKLKEKFIELKSKAEERDTIPVIIGLNTDFKSEGKLTYSKINVQKNKIKQDQDSLISFLSSYKVDNIHKFEHVPFIAMTVDKESLERLKFSPLIATISEDIVFKPYLKVSVPLIGAPLAWSSGSTGQGQTIGILDTGVDKNHSFLSGKVVSEACYSSSVSDDPGTSKNEESFSVCPGGVSEVTGSDTGLPCSIIGCDHGTHVAGIAAGDDVGISGVAKDASIISIQVFSIFTDADPKTPGNQLGVQTYVSDVVKGLDQIATLSGMHDISSVNLSLGGGAYFSAAECDADNELSSLKLAVENLRSIGIVTVASSGNDGSPSFMGAPACLSNVVSVGSTTKSDLISGFSNTPNFLDLFAPGSSIESSVPGGNFLFLSGTSMAAPHVAGAWAVLKSGNQGATIDQVFNSLKNTGFLIFDSVPRIDVDDALNDLVAPIPPIIISFEDFESGFNTWLNTVGDDNDCWRRDSSGTPSANTGPSTGADGTTWYVFYESSQSCSPDVGQQGFLLHNMIIDFNAFNNVEVTFSRHMWDGYKSGSQMGRLGLELEDSPGSGTFTEVWFQQGNQGNTWNQITVDLSSADGTGDRQIRFVATEVVAGVRSDMAVDEITIQRNSN